MYDQWPPLPSNIHNSYGQYSGPILHRLQMTITKIVENTELHSSYILQYIYV